MTAVEKVSSEISRVLSPDGLFVFSLMSKSHMLEMGAAPAKVDTKFEYPADSHRRFCVEMDKSDLASFFSDLKEFIYTNPLRVTDADLIVDTALSIFNGMMYPDLTPHKNDFRRIVLSEMKQNNGVFRLTTKYGLYICRKK